MAALLGEQRKGKERAATSEVGVDYALSRFKINANRSMLVVGPLHLAQGRRPAS